MPDRKTLHQITIGLTMIVAILAVVGMFRTEYVPLIILQGICLVFVINAARAQLSSKGATIESVAYGLAGLIAILIATIVGWNI